MAAAFLAAGAHDIIDLFVVVRHIELLAGEHAVLLVVPGALRKKAAAELKIAAVVMFQTDFFHIFLHVLSFLRVLLPDGDRTLAGVIWRQASIAGKALSMIAATKQQNRMPLAVVFL